MYHNFVENGPPFCSGIENINSYLKTKNSDKTIENKDAFLIIQGKLKIFDFIKLDERLINNIEFIDLPGLNNNIDNEFIKLDYYKKIIKFSNSCLYVNDPSSYQDGNNVNQILTHIENDINRISLKIRPEFFTTCLFLVNKADLVPKDNDRQQIQVTLTQSIKKKFKQYQIPNLNFSFFSGKFFLEYLYNYKMYVECLENDPFQVIYYLFEEYSDSWFSFDFKKFLIKKIEKIAEQLKIKLSKGACVPQTFYDKMISGFNELYMNIGGKNIKDEKDIIEKFYCLHYEIKNHDFSNTNYSKIFFDKLGEIIIKIDNLQKKNFNEYVKEFFHFLDELFMREIVIENEKQLAENRDRYILFKDKIIPNIDNKMFLKQEKLKKIINDTKDECISIIDDEINNAKSRLKDSDNDLEKAVKKMETKLTEKVDNMKKNCENEIKLIGEEIEEETKEAINIFYNTKDIPASKLETKKAETKNMIITLVSGALGGVASGLGLYAGGAAVAAGVAAGTMSITGMTTFIGAFFGPIGIIGGLVIGGLISGLVLFFRKEKKYKDALEQNKNQIEKAFKENEENIIRDFGIFKQDLKIELDKKVEVLHKKLEFDKEEWENVKLEYKAMREKILKKLEKVKN